MAKDLPAGFDRSRILAGLHKAMEFGEPTRTEDRATFYLVTTTTEEGAVKDDEDVPFDPTATRTVTPAPKTVPCAVEYHDRAETAETFGILARSSIEITLLDPEYQLVKGFPYVVCGGDKYYYLKTEPPMALGSLDVWIVHCVSEDER